MRRLLLLGVLAALLVLLAAPAMTVVAGEEKGGERSRRVVRERGGEGELKRRPEPRREGEGEFVSPEQQLLNRITALQRAVAALRAKAVELLGEAKGIAFTKEAVTKAVQAGMTPKKEGEGGERRKEGGAERIEQHRLREGEGRRER
jgi:hypothetical protein